MRLLHTSDWHLGRTLHGVDLLEHQAAYLDHLVELARAEQVDAVLVAGDVYDRAIPSVEAVAVLSDALGMPVRLRLSANGIRTIEHNGGIDAYVLSVPDAKLAPDIRRLKRRIERAVARKAEQPAA